MEHEKRHGKIHGISAGDLQGHIKTHGAAHYEPGAGHGDGHGHGGHKNGPRQLHHMYVPIASQGYMLEGGKKVPPHTMHVHTRSAFLSDLLDSSWRGNLGTAYRFYFWAIVMFIGMVFFYGINLYVAAVFAFFAGVFWSQRLVQPPWNITWFKGKALYYVK